MPFAELPPEQGAELVDLNVLAPGAGQGGAARHAGPVVRHHHQRRFAAGIQRRRAGGFLPKRAVYAGSKAFLVTFSQALAEEVRDGGVQVQVVCPGLVRSEFHTRQGLDMSAGPRMEPGQVAAASLADLAGRVLVSVPGLGGTGALARFEAASQELVARPVPRNSPPGTAATPADQQR